ncbi:DUF3164 family protein [Pseudomonas sp. NPDC079086]|uniref:DUF3164 family protein n=1 Tax=unclassified Pseudomonas TaxID=196821 RepID=UPI0037C60080
MQQAQQIVIPEGWVRNAIGNLVHETEIREQDKLRDGVVTEIAKKAVELNAALKSLKEKALADIADLISIAGEKYDMKLGGPKGNVTLTSFDGGYRVQRVCADRITYTEEMEVAKAKVFECIRSWSDVSHKHLVTIASNAFRLNRQGEISVARVAELMRIEIDDPEWRKAMEAVKDSLSVAGKAVYIRIQERQADDSYETIILDIAGV